MIRTVPTVLISTMGVIEVEVEVEEVEEDEDEDEEVHLNS